MSGTSVLSQRWAQLRWAGPWTMPVRPSGCFQHCTLVVPSRIGPARSKEPRSSQVARTSGSRPFLAGAKVRHEVQRGDAYAQGLGDPANDKEAQNVLSVNFSCSSRLKAQCSRTASNHLFEANKPPAGFFSESRSFIGSADLVQRAREGGQQRHRTQTHPLSFRRIQGMHGTLALQA